jgi:hypothetical protein
MHETPRALLELPESLDELAVSIHHCDAIGILERLGEDREH